MTYASQALPQSRADRWPSAVNRTPARLLALHITCAEPQSHHSQPQALLQPLPLSPARKAKPDTPQYSCRPAWQLASDQPFQPASSSLCVSAPRSDAHPGGHLSGLVPRAPARCVRTSSLGASNTLDASAPGTYKEQLGAAWPVWTQANSSSPSLSSSWKSSHNTTPQTGVFCTWAAFYAPKWFIKSRTA